MSDAIDPSAIYELQTVDSPSMAPDGSRVAFVRGWIDREAMESRSQIVVVPTLADGGPVAGFTSGNRDKAPRFSPDGQTLAFLRPDDKDLRQLWLLPLSGGEAKQLTHEPSAVAEYAWSPDSGAIAFVSDVDPDRLPEDHDAKKDPQVFVMQRIRYRYDMLGWRGDIHRHLFVKDVNEASARQITDGDGDDSAPVWSPDGRRIAFISDRAADRDTSAFTHAYVVPVEGGASVCWSQELVSAASVAWSPDGRRLAAIGSQDQAIVPGWQGWIYLLEPGERPVQITNDSINPAGGFAPLVAPLEFRWTRDHHNAERIVFVGSKQGQSSLWSASVDGQQLEALSGGHAQFNGVSFNAAGTHVVVQATSPNSAGDLHLIDIGQCSQAVLTHHNEGFFREHPPARLEKFRFTRADFEIECRLYLPSDHDASKRYPLVVDIHGGPHGVFHDSFNLTQQMLASAGYMVLCVNPRGSASYGAAFAKAVLLDWGGEDYIDILTAVDTVCARADVDSSRLGLHGYSYGGYMGAWIVGHDHRFRAAVLGAPVIDLPAMNGTSDIAVPFGEVQWGGTLHDDEGAWLRHSPLSYAAAVETPVLLLHGEADHRVPIEQSEAFFVALKQLGKEVEMVRFPGSGHQFVNQGHPRLREAYFERVLGWFEQYLR